MKLKTSFPGKLLPFGKQKYIVNDTSSKPFSSENTGLPDLNAGLYVLGGIILVMILMLLFWPVASHAQDKSTTGLKIGDQVPDITISKIINYKAPDGKPTSTAKISDFKGKLLILDFWATWCSPCVAMIPKMDSLQKEFAGKLQFLPVAYQGTEEVTSFLDKLQKLKKREYDLPDITGDTSLGELFPHTYLPHFVWIDRNGKVTSITDYPEVNEGNIKRVLSEPSLRLPEKKDPTKIPYDKHLPLLINNNGGNGQSLIYHSLLTSYIDGLTGGASQYPADSIKGFKITLRNVPIVWLYRIAYGEIYGDRKQFFPFNRIKLLVKDSSRLNSTLVGDAYLNWLRRGNGYCYELIVPPALASQAYKIMQKDLWQFFTHYKAQIKKSRENCLVLVRTAKANQLHTFGGKQEASFDATGCRLQNLPLKTLIDQLNVIYMQKSPFPVIDESGWKTPVDLILQANLSNAESLNKALERYGLKLIKARRKIDILIIRDNNPPNPI